MTPDGMRQACLQQIDLIGESASVMFLRSGKWGSKDTARLFPRSPDSPIGDIVSDMGGKLHLLCNAREVLAWLDKHVQESQ